MHRRALPRCATLDHLQGRLPSPTARLKSYTAFRRPEWSKEAHADQAGQVEALTEAMLYHNTKGDSLPGWNHRKIRGGTYQRVSDLVAQNISRPIEASVKTAGTVTTSSMLDPLEDFDPRSSRMENGTFVEIRRSQFDIEHGIVIDGGAHLSSGQRQSYVMLSASGAVDLFRADICHVAIPNIVSLDLASRCNKGAATELDPSKRNPGDVVDPGARVAAVKRLQEIERAIEIEVMRLTTKFNTLYSRVKSQDPERWAYLALLEAVKMLDPRPTIPSVTLVATHKLLMKNSLHFVAAVSNQRSIQAYSVRPQAVVDNFHFVVDLLRENKRARRAFVDTARKRIALNTDQMARTRDHAASFSTAANNLPPWTEDDLKIVQFLRNSAGGWRSTQSDPYASHSAVLLKQIVDSRDRIDNEVVYLTLVDMGVLAPWSDPSINDAATREADEFSSVQARDERLIAKALKSARPLAETATAKASTILGPEDYYSIDPCDTIRHDFGDLPVYIIDDLGAEELDDGVSVEKIAMEPNRTWIHVHIADPTSILHPGHVFSRRAEELWETMYFVQRTIPMIPSQLSSRKLSLETSHGSQATLTISMKIDDSGSIVDYKIRPGIIRKPVVLRYDDVDQRLSLETMNSLRPFDPPRRPNPPVPPKSSTDKLTNTQINDLRELVRVRDCMTSQRMRTDMILWSLPKVDVKLKAQPPMQPSGDVAGVFAGFPTIKYEVLETKETEKGSRLLVAEFMKAAGRVASRFLMDRGIPAIRRGSCSPTFLSPQARDELLAIRDHLGYVPVADALTKMQDTSRGYIGLGLLGHWATGVPDGEGYVRVTSPLRRYLDLAVHWQIKHALLNRPASSAPFSEADLFRLCRIALRNSSGRRAILNRNTRWWAVKRLERWMQDKEAGRLTPSELEYDPLETLQAIPLLEYAVANIITAENQQPVMLPSLGLRATCIVPSLTEPRPVWQPFPVRVKSYDLGMFPTVVVEPR